MPQGCQRVFRIVSSPLTKDERFRKVIDFTRRLYEDLSLEERLQEVQA
jgi:hypothetical protein